jgi:hypothetical protein
VYEVTAYIPDMSCQASKRALHRQRQARYEARLRDGVALYPAPLGAVEIDALVALGWLREGTETDRGRVGEAVAAAIRDMAYRLRLNS